MIMKTSKRTENILIDNAWNVVEPKKATMCVHNVYDEKGELIEQTIYNRTVEPKKEFNPNHDPENGQFTDGDSGGSAKSIDFDTAFKRYDAFKSSSELPAFSFDPSSNTGYTANKPSDRQALLKDYTDGKSDLFVIAVTNHGGGLSRESHSAYTQITNEGRQGLVGFWTSDETGFEYTDVSFPADKGMTDLEAGKLLDKYAQESALKITRDGNAVFINSKGEVVGTL